MCSFSFLLLTCQSGQLSLYCFDCGALIDQTFACFDRNRNLFVDHDLRTVYVILFLEIVVVYFGLTRDRTEITGEERGRGRSDLEFRFGTRIAYSFRDTEFKSCSRSSCDAMLLLVFLNSLL